jgi:hypothetical protein
MLVLARPGLAVEVLDDQMQIDERAAQIVQTSNSLCWEMYRYHQMQPDYAQAYRAAKQLWAQAGALRDTLWAGPMESEALAQQVQQMADLLDRVEKTLAKWGDGDRSLVPSNAGPGMRTIVTPGASVDIPFVGIQVGGPRVAVVEDGAPVLERRRLHANSRGSKRSLERELAAVRVAFGYLQEDSGVTATPLPPAPGRAPSGGPVPHPFDADPAFNPPTKISPPAAGKTGSGTNRK